jgi:hypothetical protein
MFNSLETKRTVIAEHHNPPLRIVDSVGWKLFRRKAAVNVEDVD